MCIQVLSKMSDQRLNKNEKRVEFKVDADRRRNDDRVIIIDDQNDDITEEVCIYI